MSHSIVVRLDLFTKCVSNETSKQFVIEVAPLIHLFVHLLQACTEMVMPSCSDGVNDMFEPGPWNYTHYAAVCQKK